MAGPITIRSHGVNLYVVDGRDGKLLFDAGWPRSLPDLKAGLEAAGLRLSAIRFVMTSHAHPDHGGLMQKLKRHCGVRRIVHEVQRVSLAELNRFFERKPDRNYEPIEIDDKDLVVGRADLQALRAIGIEGEILETPGHSDDSVSLLLDGGDAFTGDLTRPDLATTRARGGRGRELEEAHGAGRGDVLSRPTAGCSPRASSGRCCGPGTGRETRTNRGGTPMRPERQAHEQPFAVGELGWRYHHLGIPTTVPRPGEVYLPHLKIHVAGFETSPFGIEWMRFDPDCGIHELIRTRAAPGLRGGRSGGRVGRPARHQPDELAVRRRARRHDRRRWRAGRADGVLETLGRLGRPVATALTSLRGRRYDVGTPIRRRSRMSPYRRLSRAAVTAAVLALILGQAASPAFAAAPQRTLPGVPPDIDATVARAMKAFEVPGLALAIVKDGKVVLAKGYGMRTLGQPATVDAKTLFGIASNSKVFTATALGLLVEEGKIAWDAPVVDYLPWFMMSDPYVTRELTVRDLLVHRSGLGLGAGDLLWWPESTYNRRQVAERLRFIKPATSFRSAYAYDNVLYLVAGEVIQAVTGRTWEDFVLERILKKVGMTGSNVRHSAAAEGGNVATPHARVEGAVRPIAPFTSDNTNPAGGINSGAEDMAKWMLVRLARGKLADGTALYSERTARELETPVTILPNPAPAPELAPRKAHFRAYALGLDIRDYRGHLVIDHTGGLPGYVSIVTLLPERNLGVAILTNAESTSAFYALTQQIVDYDLGAPPMDWVAAYLKRDARIDAETAEAAGPVGGGPRGLVQAVAPAREVRRRLHGRLVRRRGRRGGRRQAGHALLQDPGPDRRPGALAVRHLHRPLARPRAPGRRLCHLRPQPGRFDRPGQDGSRLAGDRFQLRFPGPRSEAGAQAAEISRFTQNLDRAAGRGYHARGKEIGHEGRFIGCPLGPDPGLHPLLHRHDPGRRLGRPGS